MKAVVDPLQRTLPHSIDAETAALGVVLAHGDLWPELAARLTAGDWFRDAHRRVFEAMAVLAEQAVAVDFVTVKEQLVRAGDLDEVGGPAYLASLADGVPRSTNLAHYAGIVADTARLRRIIGVTNKLQAAAYEYGTTSAELVETGTRDLLALASVGDADAVQIGAAVADFLASLDEDQSASVVPTGFTDIDSLLGGGLRRGDMTVLAARPSVGKTAFAMNTAEHAAGRAYPAVMFSLEMATRPLVSRSISGRARVPLARLRGGHIDEHDGVRLAEAQMALDALPLYIQDAARTLTQIAAWTHRLQQRPGGLALVVVDYLQLLAHEGGALDSRQREVSAISRGLKRLAQDQHLAVLALSQLSRAPDERTDKRPHLSDLRESGQIEQDADVVVFLFREEMHKPTDENRGIAEAIIAKQRNGPTGVARLAFQKDYVRFADLAR